MYARFFLSVALIGFFQTPVFANASEISSQFLCNKYSQSTFGFFNKTLCAEGIDLAIPYEIACVYPDVAQDQGFCQTPSMKYSYETAVFWPKTLPVTPFVESLGDKVLKKIAKVSSLETDSLETACSINSGWVKDRILCVPFQAEKRPLIDRAPLPETQIIRDEVVFGSGSVQITTTEINSLKEKIEEARDQILDELEGWDNPNGRFVVTQLEVVGRADIRGNKEQNGQLAKARMENLVEKSIETLIDLSIIEDNETELKALSEVLLVDSYVQSEECEKIKQDVSGYQWVTVQPTKAQKEAYQQTIAQLEADYQRRLAEYNKNPYESYGPSISRWGISLGGRYKKSPPRRYHYNLGGLKPYEDLQWVEGTILVQDPQCLQDNRSGSVTITLEYRDSTPIKDLINQQR